MRKLLIVSIAAFVLATFGFLGIASMNYGMHAAFAEEEEVINDTCPVMGKEVDKNTPYRVEYKGKAIGFCCPGCIAKFNADPEKYMAQIQKKESDAESQMMEKKGSGTAKKGSATLKKGSGTESHEGHSH